MHSRKNSMQLGKNLPGFKGKGSKTTWRICSVMCLYLFWMICNILPQSNWRWGRVLLSQKFHSLDPTPRTYKTSVSWLVKICQHLHRNVKSVKSLKCMKYPKFVKCVKPWGFPLVDWMKSQKQTQLVGMGKKAEKVTFLRLWRQSWPGQDNGRSLTLECGTFLLEWELADFWTSWWIGGRVARSA